MNEWIEHSGGPWLQGNDISYADIAIMPVIIRLEDINLSHFWDDFPGIQDFTKDQQSGKSKVHIRKTFTKSVQE